jgi:Zn-dependent peptidase ImmA (M78 family)
MKLPDKVLIDDIEYKVEEVSHKELQLSSEDLKGEYWGDTRYKQASMRICEGMTEDEAKITLVHEIIHAILHERAFDKQNNDEAMVDGLAHALRMLAKQNPELIKEVLS